ncbi:MAG: tRNA (adenosine(37)-N6)-threonylcarbamoyltransferase complex dimerization subunit type 1 TsaB [Burkholderiales bacterium]
MSRPANVVAFETSSETISVAVARGEQIVSREITEAGQLSGELALPTMHALLAEAGLCLAELDVVVFGQGPGSFTGVRVACGVSQGLAYGLGKPVIALPTPLALAEAATRGGAERILVAADARMGEIYLAAYVQDSTQPTGFGEVVSPCLLKPEEFEQLIIPQLPAKHLASRWVGVGSAFAVPTLTDALTASRLISIVVSGAPAFPLAADLVRVARRLLNRVGDAATIRPHDAAPLYVRNKVALTIEERLLITRAKAEGAVEAKAHSTSPPLAGFAS